MIVTGPDGVTHDYFGNDLAAIMMAREIAEQFPGEPVNLTGVGSDGSAVNATLRWSTADGVTHVDHLADVGAPA